MRISSVFKVISVVVVFVPLTAHAIPPPEILVTVWQSALMGLGLGIAFLSVICGLCRDWIRAHGSRKGWLLLCISIASAGGWFWRDSLPSPPKTFHLADEWGAVVSIDEIIATEQNPRSREFKRRTYDEMRNALLAFRKQKGLPVPEFASIRSIHPQEFHDAVMNRSEELWMLDVRDPLEREHLRIPIHEAMSYGDLANGVDFDFPPDKTVVVYCHSGLRGYIAASLLRTAGVEDVVFLRDGMQNWMDLDLPFDGDNQFPFLIYSYEEYRPSMAKSPRIRKIDFTFGGAAAKSFPNTTPLYYELSTTDEIRTFLKSLDREPVLLLVQTESEQYDAVCFAKRYEAMGGKVHGYVLIQP
jgi:rhodanese-related sulfurtransferase